MSIATPARSAIAAEERDRGERGVNEHHEVENGSDPSIFGPNLQSHAAKTGTVSLSPGARCNNCRWSACATRVGLE